MRQTPMLLIAAALLATSAQAQTVKSGTGAGATTARNAFRADLGGGIVAGPAGSFGGVRREINWDGVPNGRADPNPLPANFFNTTSPRGVVFSTPGTGFLVSANAGAGPPVEFGHADLFAPFSAQRLFTEVGSNVMDVNFFVPGTSTAALTRGFGVVFSDVDLASTTSIQLFDRSNGSLGTYFAPNVPGANETFSFLGISFADARIARARITTGNAALSPGAVETSTVDLVAMDDFLFGEPVRAPVPEPASWALMISGLGLAGVALRRRAYRVAAARV